MKEFDFLPEWYKSDRKRLVSYRRQYFVMGCLFVMMVTWNFVTGQMISSAAAELYLPSHVQGLQILQKRAGDIYKRITQFNEKAALLDEIDSKIDVSSVLAEISYLVDERIVLRHVNINAEKFDLPRAGSEVFGMRDTKYGKAKGLLFGAVRFKILIGGLAAGTSDVAELICKLEQSPWFFQVYPLYSKNSSIDIARETGGKKYPATEFEIGCYLANYE
ncbi:MAG: hypothetical protein ACYSRR_00295 [Planctomycetota bacterium]|jgi:hypothetical protein